MIIQIKELGAIKEATINLNKKLTVFCGPNGTGKTYMAYILYALTKLDNKSLGIRLSDDMSKTMIENNKIDLEIDFDAIWEFRNKEVEKLKDNLWNLFAIPEAKSENFFGKTAIHFMESKDEFIQNLEDISINEHLKFYDYTVHLTKLPNSNIVKLVVPENTLKNKDFFNFLEIVLLSKIYTILAFFPIVSSTIFPVERNSIYTFSNELSIRKNDALEHIQAITNKKDFNLFDLVFKRTTRYPQPIRDGLEVAEDLEIIQQRNSDYYQFASDIEAELLKGKVVINKESGSVEFISEKAPRIKLSFHQSSSIVKTLASLVIYLKHRATKNDLVIIDEPELNLHPDNQVKLARIFARLINNGLRLVISTHSDYIIREFNNLVMLSNKENEIAEIAEKYNYKKDEYLLANEIGVYIFNYKNKSSKQTEVKQIKIDENGFEVETLDNTIDELNKISDELYYTLKYGAATT